jgi:GT2 family glycosyltransferase
MKVSVIVPARDSEKTIGECVRALLAQDFTRSEYEVIVVDDGSKDRTAEAAREAGAAVLSIPPSGPAAARNRGAAAAGGELLAFTDADCVPDPGWLKALTAPLSDPEVTATKGVYRSEQEPLTARFVQLEYESRYRRMAGRRRIDFIDTYSAAFRRDLYLRCGGSDESFPTACTEDQELGFRYAREGGEMRFVPEAVVRHRHADSPRRYFRKKLKIGFWKARVLRRHPGKIRGDSHTPQAVKVEMLAALGALVSLAVALAGGGLWPLLGSLSVLFASGGPLIAEAFRRRRSLGFAALGLVPLRAVGLGLGLLTGAAGGLLAWGPSLAVWAVLVTAFFFISSSPLVAATGGFWKNALLLFLLAYLALLTGARIFRRFAGRFPARGGWDPLERTAMELGLGMGALMAALFLLGVLGLYRPAAAWGLLCLLAAANHRVHLSELAARFRPHLGGGARPSLLIGGAAAMVAAMTFFESLAPATAQDALAYHLAVPAKYLEQGGITYIPESFFAQFPANTEMLFTLALLLGDSRLAGGCHWLLGAAAALAVAALARRLLARSALAAAPGEDRGELSPSPGAGGGLLAAAIFATVPTAALIAGWAYVDLTLVLFQLLSTLAFLRWWEMGRPAPAAGETAPPANTPREKRTGLLVLAALFAGLAAGTKYTGGAQGIVIVLGVVLEAHLRGRRLRDAAAAAGLAACVTAALVGPWWVKNLVYTGNPLHPFLFGILGGRGWDGERARALSAFLGGWGGPSGPLEPLLLPWRLTMSARFFSIERYDGMIGPAFLLGAPLVLSALFQTKRRGRLEGGAGAATSPLLAVAGGIGLAHALLWLFLSRQVRFLLPALSVGAALIEASLPLALEPGRWRSTWMGALKLGIGFNVVLIATHFAAHNPLPVVLGLEPEKSYLCREVPGGDYAVFEAIDRLLPLESRILFGGSGNPGFLCKRPYHADALFENRTLLEVLIAGKEPAGVRDELLRRGFTHLLFRWELVFDPSGLRSEIPLPQQLLLADFLNRHARLVHRASTTCLYAIEVAR